MAAITFTYCEFGGAFFDLFLTVPKNIYSEDVLSNFPLHQPTELHFYKGIVAMQDGKPIGRVAIYNNPQLMHNGTPAGTLGSYECVQDQEASNAILNEARRLAAELGLYWLLGPMEGSTWNSYRFYTTEIVRPYFMEPWHHYYYANQWKSAGWDLAATYFSNIDDNLVHDNAALEHFEQHFIALGAKFRTLDLANLESELLKIGAFSIEAFAENLYYTPITARQFADKYLPVAQFMDPNLILLVEDEKGEIQALLFALKDHFDPTGQTAIVKTLARKKTSSFRGIGTYLSGKVNQIFKEQGYSKVIHALMLDENKSVEISGNFRGELFRNYSLYCTQI